MDPTIYYGVQSGPYWDWKVALDLFLGGAGAGAFVFSVALYELWGQRFRRIPQTAAYLAPLLVGAGLLLLLLKLGRPHHLIQTFTNVAPTAPLWWGGVFQTLFIVGSIWYALLWRNQDPDSVRRTLGLVLAPIAVIVAAYHGMLLAVVTSRPLWNTGPTVVGALLGFVTTGIAAVLVLHLLRMGIRGRLEDADHVTSFLEDLQPVRNLLVVALLAQLGTLFFWWVSLHFGALADRTALQAANMSYGSTFWGLGIVVGLIVPLVLGAYVVWNGDRSNHRLQVWTVGITSVLILLGGYSFRLAVVLAGQLNPVYVSLP